MRTRLGIIGGGAAGLMSAVSALRLGLHVTVLEGGSSAGKKLSASGNGRGNFTNRNLSPDRYPGNDHAFLEAAFSHFDQYDAIAFFESIGIYTRLRNGYVYPRSEQASALTAALLKEFDVLGGKLACGCKVAEIKPEQGRFAVIASDGRTYSFDKLILAAGGMTAARTGSDGSGFSLAASLGHKITPPVPALAGLSVKKGALSKAAGVRTEAAVTLRMEEKTSHTERGELQITEQGISGIPVMHLSRYASRALSEGKTVEALIDFLPEWEPDEAREIAGKCRDLSGILPLKLAKIFSLGSDPIALCKEYTVRITSVRDLETAQVTCGGVSLGEVDPHTMASRIVRDLYLAGEVLDVDGRCGGYNLQWAWTSGAIAAYGAAGKPCVHHKPDKAFMGRLDKAEVADRRK